MEDHESFVSLGEVYEGDRQRQVRMSSVYVAFSLDKGIMDLIGVRRDPELRDLASYVSLGILETKLFLLPLGARGTDGS